VAVSCVILPADPALATLAPTWLLLEELNAGRLFLDDILSGGKLYGVSLVSSSI